MRIRIMACSRTIMACLALVAGWLTTANVHAAEYSVGAHASAVSISSDAAGSGIVSTVGIPGSAMSYQPGLRIAIASDPDHHREIVLDGGTFRVWDSGTVVSMTIASIGYQYAMKRPGWLQGFARAVAGVYRVKGALGASTSSTYGAGVGVRHVVHDEHGAFRLEVSWDRLSRDESIERPALTLIGARLGFDMWL